MMHPLRSLSLAFPRSCSRALALPSSVLPLLARSLAHALIAPPSCAPDDRLVGGGAGRKKADSRRYVPLSWTHCIHVCVYVLAPHLCVYV